jgi:hypothetical protein
MSLFVVTLCLYALNRRCASTLPAVVVTAAALIPLYGSMTPRPQLVSFALLTVTVGAWIRTERDLEPRWWLVPLIWCWSLCHGFWFVGAAYGFLGVGAVVLGRRASLRQVLRLALLAGACVAVVLLNPVGPRLFEQPFAVNSASRFITEWQHPTPWSAGPLGAWLLILATLGIWALTRRGVGPLAVLLLLSAAFWAWYAERTVAVSALVSAPVLAQALDSVIGRDEPTREQRRHGALDRLEWKVVAVTCAVAALALGALVPSVAREPGDVPLALDRTLDRVPRGSGVYSAYVLGGWVAWRHPDLEQYIDGLATPYSTRHYLDFFEIQDTRPGWYGLMQRDHLTVAVVTRGSPLADALARHGWTMQGADAGYVLLTAPGVLRSP